MDADFLLGVSGEIAADNKVTSKASTEKAKEIVAKNAEPSTAKAAETVATAEPSTAKSAETVAKDAELPTATAAETRAETCDVAKFAQGIALKKGDPRPHLYFCKGT